MKARVRHLPAWLLLAVYGAVSWCGQGLHALPGCEHTAACPEACCQAHAHGAHGGPSRGDGWRSEAPQAIHDDGCLICLFHAQAQLSASLAVAAFHAPCHPRHPVAVEPQFCGKINHPALPRGPPA